MCGHMVNNCSVSVSSFINVVLIAKGIGICLVVFSHYIPFDSPEYWVLSRDIVYKFHMPLFFLLSGYLYKGYSGGYINHVMNKSKRLALPFFSIALLFLVIKGIASSVVGMDNPITNNSILQVITCPINSYMPLLWFIYTLFFIFLLYPLLERVLSENYLILILSLLMLAIPISLGGCLNSFVKNFPYFCAGVLIARYFYLDDDWGYKRAFSGLVICIVLFLAVFKYINVSSEANWFLFRFRDLLLGLIGIAVVIQLSNLINSFNAVVPARVFKSFGYYSMSIYLFHTLFESGARHIFYQAFDPDLFGFEFKAVVSIMFGILFPLLLEKYILRKTKLSRVFILGLKK